MNTPSKKQITDLLHAWISQRPGLDPCNYGFPAYSAEQFREASRAFNAEARSITRDLHDARELLKAVEWRDGITAENLVEAFRAFSGRLQLTEEDGEYRLEYCTGQYWPTEYRAAACAVLASALWDYHRADCTSDELRAKMLRIFGKGIQSRWMN